MTDKKESAWNDAPEVEDVNIADEAIKQQMVDDGEKFEIVAMLYSKTGQYGPFFTATILRHDGSEWTMSLNAANPEMGRTKVNAWIWRSLNKNGVKSIPATLVKRGRAYSFADPDSIALPDSTSGSELRTSVNDEPTDIPL